MSEYAAEYDDGWEDEDDLELFEDDDDDSRTLAINEEIADFEQREGLDLSDEDWQHIGLQIDLYGITPEDAYSRTEPGREDERLGDLAERIAQGEGRTLTRSELERLVDADEHAELTGEDDIDVRAALFDLDSSDGRAAYMAERLQVPQERDEPSADVLDPETGESKPGYDLDDINERAAAIDALMGGEDVAGYDSTYESGDE